MDHYVIETKNLWKTFGSFPAVQNVGLHVPERNIYGFLGLNGAGKTTTIRMLLGLSRPSRGMIRLFERGVEGNSLGLLGRVGTLVESPSFYPHLTGRENIEIVCTLRGLKKNEVDTALKAVDLTRESSKVVKKYSLGMCQRLGLAMALLGKPELLVLDEPTNGLDPAGIREMRDLLKLLPIEQGITVFLSSHLLAEVEQIADYVGIIHKGKMIFEGKLDDLKKAYRVTYFLNVDRVEEAGRAIQSKGLEAEILDERSLTVGLQSPEQAAILNAYLNASGFRVSEIQKREPSLEDIFLQLTAMPKFQNEVNS